ncbi:hypothetical protein BH23ACT7_BH23ACT7_06040 [soil metagenome]
MSQQEARPIRVEPGHKRIRALFAGEYVADSTRVRLVWENRSTRPTSSLSRYPHRPSRRCEPGQALDAQRHRGHLRHRSRGSCCAEAVRCYRESPISGIIDHVRFDWDAMDAWFEEDEQVHVHPRDPYTRVDVLQSSRHVRVELDGVTVADSRSPRILSETGLVPRFYLPKTDVQVGLLRASDTQTSCPYKGDASYYDVEVAGQPTQTSFGGTRTPRLRPRRSPATCASTTSASTYTSTAGSGPKPQPKGRITHSWGLSGKPDATGTRSRRAGGQQGRSADDIRRANDPRTDPRP